MKQYKVNTSNHVEAIPLAIEEISPTKLILFVCGDKEVKDSFYSIIDKVEKLSNESSLACFSFRGRETNKKYSPKQMVFDLEELLEHLISKGYTNINLVATSSGFVSTVFAITNANLSDYIKKVVLLDPADYEFEGRKHTWTSYEEYKPESALISSKLRKLASNIKIHTIFFALKAWDTHLKEIVKADKLNTNNPNHVTRMNIEMTKNIHKEVPEKNRGKWIEDKVLPHAFERDFDVNNSQTIIAQYVVDLII
jgi:hypothetical protein